MEYRSAGTERGVQMTGLGRGSTVGVMAIMVMVSLRSACALEPPSPGEIARPRVTREWEERLQEARALRNHQIDPTLLEQALYRARQEVLIQQGLDPEEILPAPPSAMMPFRLRSSMHWRMS